MGLFLFNSIMLYKRNVLLNMRPCIRGAEYNQKKQTIINSYLIRFNIVPTIMQITNNFLFNNGGQINCN